MKVVWTIAGFDPSSGAGVTADLMTFAAHGLFGCSAITAYTVQSTLGVSAVEPVRTELLRASLEHLWDDTPPAGVKIGMLASADNAVATADILRERNPWEHGRHRATVVLDPVLRSSSGRELFQVGELELLHDRVLPEVDWATPNWSELALLAGTAVSSRHEVDRAAEALLEWHPGLNLVVTGGDLPVPTELVFTAEGERFELQGEHVDTTSTHGTGCAFSSALLARLLEGLDAEGAVRAAKAYVAGALRQAPGIGRGKGPLGLLWPLRQPAGR